MSGGTTWGVLALKSIFGHRLDVLEEKKNLLEKANEFFNLPRIKCMSYSDKYSIF